MVDFIVFDLETTGLATSSRITEIGAWKFKGGVLVDKFHTLVNPRCDISREIVNLTGISNEMVKNELDFYEVLPMFHEFCESLPFLAHNLEFDYRILCARGDDAEYDFTQGGTRTGLCTLKLAKSLFPGLPSYTLSSLVHHFKLDEGLATVSEFHRAKFDAYMSKRLFDVCQVRAGGVHKTLEPVLLMLKEKQEYGRVMECGSL